MRRKTFWKASVMDKDSHSELFYKNTVLENFWKLTGKQLCRNLFFNKFRVFSKSFFVEHLLTAVLEGSL